MLYFKNGVCTNEGEEVPFYTSIGQTITVRSLLDLMVDITSLQLPTYLHVLHCLLPMHFPFLGSVYIQRIILL